MAFHKGKVGSAFLFIATALVLAGAGCGNAPGATGPYAPGAPAPSAAAPATAPTQAATVATTVSLGMNPTNSSDASGTLSLEDRAGKLFILVTLTKSGAVGKFSTSLVEGNCSAPGAKLYTLGPVVNGRSATTLYVTADALRSKPATSIVVMKDEKDPKSMISCGNVDWKSALAPTPAP